MKRNLFAAMLLSLSLVGCANYHYDIQILGNVYTLQGKTVSGLTGDLCWQIRWEDSKSVTTECTPISTNGEGQFSANIIGDNEGKEMIGYNLYILVDGVKYGGKEIQRSPLQGRDGELTGTAVYNFTVNTSE